MENYSSLKCTNCGMINWATAARCKRCALALNASADDVAHDDNAPHYEHTQPDAIGAQPQDAAGTWAQEHAYEDAHAAGWGQTYQEPTHYSPYPPRVSRSMHSAASGSRRNGVIALLVMGAVVAMIVCVALPHLRGWGQPQWQLYAPFDANFSVHMPCAAKLSTKSLDTRVGQVPMQVATADLNNDEACVVMYAMYPVESLNLSYDDLHGVAQEMAEGSKTQLLSDAPHAFGERTGIEFETSAPPELKPSTHVYGRMYAIGNTVYILMLVGPNDGALVRERANFFDSFQLGSGRER